MLYWCRLYIRRRERKIKIRRGTNTLLYQPPSAPPQALSAEVNDSQTLTGGRLTFTRRAAINTLLGRRGGHEFLLLVLLFVVLLFLVFFSTSYLKEWKVIYFQSSLVLFSLFSYPFISSSSSFSFPIAMLFFFYFIFHYLYSSLSNVHSSWFTIPSLSLFTLPPPPPLSPFPPPFLLRMHKGITNHVEGGSRWCSPAWKYEARRQPNRWITQAEQYAHNIERSVIPPRRFTFLRCHEEISAQ